MKPAIHILNCRVNLGQSGDSQIQFVLNEFSAPPGTQTALTGPSGCGKSTLLNVISGLHPISQGTVMILEQTTSTLSTSQMDKFRGKHIGFIYQNFNLIHGFTAYENVMIGMRFGRMVNHTLRTQQAKSLLNRVGLSHRMNSSVENMSAGERQRVAIARAISNQPEILLADEPTGSLDPSTAHEVMDLIIKIATEQTMTFLCVTHDMEIANLFPSTFDCRNLIHTNGESK